MTPAFLAAAYDMMRLTEPFKAWKLPPSAEVRFKVVRDKKMFADFGMEGSVPVYRISTAKNGHLATTLASLCHEMLHHVQELRGDREIHGPRFQKMAGRVCRLHGFDPKSF